MNAGDARNDKSAWRAQLRKGRGERRRDQGPAGQLLATALLHDATVQELLPLMRPETPGKAVASYVATPDEPPTDVLHARLRRAGIAVFVPWALPDRSMRWLLDGEGRALPWGLPGVGAPRHPETALSSAALLQEPVALVIVPALGLASDGARLGHGGGYYDRFLATLPNHSAGGPLRVGVTWADCVVAELPTQPHDQRVDIVIGV